MIMIRIIPNKGYIFRYIGNSVSVLKWVYVIYMCIYIYRKPSSISYCVKTTMDEMYTHVLPRVYLHSEVKGIEKCVCLMSSLWRGHPKVRIYDDILWNQQLLNKKIVLWICLLLHVMLHCILYIFFFFSWWENCIWGLIANSTNVLLNTKNERK